MQNKDFRIIIFNKHILIISEQWVNGHVASLELSIGISNHSFDLVLGESLIVILVPFLEKLLPHFFGFLLRDTKLFHADLDIGALTFVIVDIAVTIFVKFLHNVVEFLLLSDT